MTRSEMLALLVLGNLVLAVAPTSPVAAQSVYNPGETEEAHRAERVRIQACKLLAERDPARFAYTTSCAGTVVPSGPDPETARNLVERQRQLDEITINKLIQRCDRVRSDQASVALTVECQRLMNR